MKTITKTFTITATPDTMIRFEHFMAFLHFNGGHSGCFGMTFDGDGHERFKSDPPPQRLGKAHWLINTGQELEVAKDKCYESRRIDHESHYYRSYEANLYKIGTDGSSVLIKTVES